MKALLRLVAKHGMKKQFMNLKNTNLRKMVRMALALPFCPPKKIKKAMEFITDLSEVLDNQSQIKFGKKFIKYLDKTWINGKYPIKTWNYFCK